MFKAENFQILEKKSKLKNCSKSRRNENGIERKKRKNIYKNKKNKDRKTLEPTGKFSQKLKKYQLGQAHAAKHAGGDC
jgi:hypothetical protein